MRKFFSKFQTKNSLKNLYFSRNRTFTTQDASLDENNSYKDGSVLAQYLDFHYSPERYFNTENFAYTCAQLCVSTCSENNVPLNTALDAGCSTGRTSFELAKLGFQQVYGVDSSERFLRIAKKLKDKGKFKYARVNEGHIHEMREIDLNEMGLEEAREKVQFEQGNMEDFLINKPQKFNLIFAGNLICRMQYPKNFWEPHITH